MEEEIIFTHLPMIYGEVVQGKIIGNGKIDGYEYKIKNIGGSHPTAYIKLDETHPLYNEHYDDIDIDVHGGLIYGEMEDDGYWIGWDYAHCYDYVWGISFVEFQRQWTTDEILEHCKDVVRQLKEYEEVKL